MIWVLINRVVPISARGIGPSEGGGTTEVGGKGKGDEQHTKDEAASFHKNLLNFLPMLTDLRFRIHLLILCSIKDSRSIEPSALRAKG